MWGVPLGMEAFLGSRGHSWMWRLIGAPPGEWAAAAYRRHIEGAGSHRCMKNRIGGEGPMTECGSTSGDGTSLRGPAVPPLGGEGST